MSSARRPLGGQRPRSGVPLLADMSVTTTPYRLFARAIVAGALTAAALLATGAPLRAQDFAVPRAAYVVRLSAMPVHLESAPEVLRQPVTLRLERVTVARALDELIARTHISLTYSRAFIPADRIVSVDVEGESVLQTLGRLLGDSGVEVWVSNSGRIALVPADNPAPAPARTPALDEGVSAPVMAAVITGRVVDSATSQPIAECAGLRGRHAARRAEQRGGTLHHCWGSAGTHTVRVNLIGFAPHSGGYRRRRPVGDHRLRHATSAGRARDRLSPSGTGHRWRGTSPAGSPREHGPGRGPRRSQGVDKASPARWPGVQVLQSNGVPGGGPQIQVRGVGAIGAGSQPLFVVHGFPLPAERRPRRGPAEPDRAERHRVDHRAQGTPRSAGDRRLSRGEWRRRYHDEVRREPCARGANGSRPSASTRFRSGTSPT